MLDHTITGNAHVYGDNIDTDGIIAGKYTKTLDLTLLADHVLEDVDPAFRHTVAPGDILVAGENFGCGSSREQAPLALKSAGIAAVVAGSFARIFFRNAINIGLPVLEGRDIDIRTGDTIEITIGQGRIHNLSRGTSGNIVPLSHIAIDILSHGGLTHYLRKHGHYRFAG